MSLIYIFECIENEDQTIQPYNQMFSANRGTKSHPLKVVWKKMTDPII